MYEPHWRLPFALNLRNFCSLQSSGNICSIKLGIAEALFISVSSESFSLGYSTSGISLSSFWLCRSWLLIEFSLYREKKPDKLNDHMVQTSFCSCLQHLGLLVVAVCFDTMVDNLIAIVFYLWMKKTKPSHDEQIFLGMKVFLAHDIEGFALLFKGALFLLKSSISFLRGKNTLHGYSQSISHPIHLADVHLSYLVYFQVCHKLKILRNKSRLLF